MITDPQFRAARGLLNRTITPLAEAAAPSELDALCADQAHRAPGIKASKLDKLQRVVEVAAMVSIDGDAAIGAGVRLRQP